MRVKLNIKLQDKIVVLAIGERGDAKGVMQRYACGLSCLFSNFSPRYHNNFTRHIGRLADSSTQVAVVFRSALHRRIEALPDTTASLLSAVRGFERTKLYREIGDVLPRNGTTATLFESAE